MYVESAHVYILYIFVFKEDSSELSSWLKLLLLSLLFGLPIAVLHVMQVDEHFTIFYAMFDLWCY